MPTDIFKDWMGNEIKEGDEVCLIQVIQSYPRVGIALAGEITWQDQKPDEECWEKGRYHKLKMGELGLYYEWSKGNYHFIELLSMLMWSVSEKTIIAIKEISDKKELYEAKKLNS